MDLALVPCSLCHQPFPAYMEACPHCGAFRHQRQAQEAASHTTALSVSPLAVTGFVMSLVLWIIPLFGPGAAWLVSFFGLRQARNPENNRYGAGFAWAGMIIAGLQIALTIFFMTMPLWVGESHTDADGTWHWNF